MTIDGRFDTCTDEFDGIQPRNTSGRLGGGETYSRYTGIHEVYTETLYSYTLQRYVYLYTCIMVKLYAWYASWGNGLVRKWQNNGVIGVKSLPVVGVYSKLRYTGIQLNCLEDDMGLEDEFQDAWQAAGEMRSEFRCSAEGCDAYAIAGSDVCKRHGALAVVATASREIRLEAVRARLMTQLEKGLGDAVDFYEAVLKNDAEVGTKVTTRDRLLAADRLVALAGVALTGQTPGLGTGGVDGEDSMSPAEKLAELITAEMIKNGTDRILRLARRTGAIDVTGRDGT